MNDNRFARTPLSMYDKHFTRNVLWVLSLVLIFFAGIIIIGHLTEPKTLIITPYKVAIKDLKEIRFDGDSMQIVLKPNN